MGAESDHMAAMALCARPGPQADSATTTCVAPSTCWGIPGRVTVQPLVLKARIKTPLMVLNKTLFLPFLFSLDLWWCFQCCPKKRKYKMWIIIAMVVSKIVGFAEMHFTPHLYIVHCWFKCRYKSITLLWGLPEITRYGLCNWPRLCVLFLQNSGASLELSPCTHTFHKHSVFILW